MFVNRKKWQGVGSYLGRLVCDIRHNEIVTSNLVSHSRGEGVWVQRLRVPMARRPPPRGSGPSSYSFQQFVPDVAIFASEKQQRLAFAHYYLLHLRDEYRVISGILR